MVSLCITSLACNAQNLSAAKEFTFQQFFATRKGDPREYIVLGSGWLRSIQSGNPGQFIADWLAAHPAAFIKPISSMGVTRTRLKRTEELVYIWVEDGESSLNVDLVSAGLFPGAVMADMVDNYNGLTEAIQKPEFAAIKAQVEKERAEAPQDRPQRLISEDQYDQLVHRIEVAESEARDRKLGIWSDAMKEERESEGYPE